MFFLLSRFIINNYLYNGKNLFNWYCLKSEILFKTWYQLCFYKIFKYKIKIKHWGSVLQNDHPKHKKTRFETI